jgi:hypothetical protein
MRPVEKNTNVKKKKIQTCGGLWVERSGDKDRDSGKEIETNRSKDTKVEIIG